MPSQAEWNRRWAQWAGKAARTARKGDPAAHRLSNTHRTESRVTLWVLWMHVCYNLGAHRAELGKRNPSRSGSCHLNLSGKHSAADLNGMERKYNLGIARLFGRLGHWRGERILHYPPLERTHNLEAGLCLNWISILIFAQVICLFGEELYITFPLLTLRTEHFKIMLCV